VRLVGVSRTFVDGAATIRALADVTLTVARGTFVALVGRSGSGKSTLLNLIAGLDTPTSGEVFVEEQPLARLGDDALTRLRRDRVGMIHQFFNLLPTLSVRENVALPALLSRDGEAGVLRRADALLDEVALGDRRAARPATLSGGEMQRAAIARALIHDPALVLADEPTGNLDSRTAAQVLGLLRDLSRRRGTTVVLVTHSHEAAGLADRRIELRDGRLASDSDGAA